MTSAAATDTIAAIATAPGPAGIGVVRISGPDSLSVADRLFIGGHRRGAPSACEGGTFLHGYIRQIEGGPDGSASIDDAPADEAILLIYRAPQSYTREDVVEIQAHGGRIPTQRVLRQVLACGVRMAEPGEFTRRAFVNGRIDLTQAEAVIDLISAQSDMAASAAIRQLRGDISRSITSIYDDVMSSLSDLEATLDFPEEEIPTSVVSSALLRLKTVSENIGGLLRTWREGHILREGTRVVIAGRPNVGKSTLLNGILRAERAIVSDIPGTTRDTVEETVIVAGYPVHLIDTAGLRDSECPVEQKGVQRAIEMGLTCDILIYVVDGSAPLCSEDAENVFRRTKEGPGDAGQHGGAARPAVIVVLNKIDKGQVVGREAFGKTTCVSCSLITPDGARPVVDALETILKSAAVTTPHAMVSERHYRGLRMTLDHVQSAIRILEDESDDIDSRQPECAAIHLRVALDELGHLTGAKYTEDLLDKIFSRFCIGK